MIGTKGFEVSEPTGFAISVLGVQYPQMKRVVVARSGAARTIAGKLLNPTPSKYLRDNTQKKYRSLTLGFAIILSRGSAK
jgi:hypothetical protein